MQIFVIGTPRSGVSCAAGLLRACGCSLISETIDTGAQDGMPEDTRERWDLRRLCDELLHAVRADWWKVSEFDIRHIPAELVATANRMLSQIAADMPRDRPLVAADPRFSFLLPLFRPLLDRPVVVHLLRYPAECAASLNACAGIPLDAGLSLWEIYTLAGLGSAAGLPTVFLSYNDLVGDPEATAASLVGQLNSLLGAGLRYPGESVGELINPALCRRRHATIQVPWEPDDPRRWLYSKLEKDRRAPDPLPTVAPASLQVLRTFEPLYDELMNFRRQAEADRTAQKQEVERRTAELRHLRDHLRQVVERAERSEAEIRRIRNSARYRIGEVLANLYRNAFPAFLREPGVPNRLLFAAARKAYRLVARSSIGRETRAPVAEGPMAQPVVPRDAAAASAAHWISVPVTVIVPIHNAPEYLQQCVESVLRHTAGPVRLILIDDASTDPKVADLLSGYETLPGVEVWSNETNLGYTKTVNRGIRAVDTDIVLLNSDTVVGPRWLVHLQAAAYGRPKIATVTPLSNNAGAFSAPVENEDNPLPPTLSADEIARLVGRTSTHLLPETPTGNGFCMYIRREAIRTIGLFDETAFPRGYGEENDFCMRARKAGWINLVSDATYVLHARSKSFGDEKKALLAAGRRILDRRYPEYTSLVRAFLGDPSMQQARANVEAAFSAVGRFDPVALSASRPNVLVVLHESGGGTPQTSRDLMHGLADRYNFYLLIGGSGVFKLYRLLYGSFVEIERGVLAAPLSGTEFTRGDYREMVREMLARHTIDLVHVRHLWGHTFDLPRVARDLGIPVVVSFHDYYFVCPTVQLLDEASRFCGGACTATAGVCPTSPRWFENVPPLKHNWVKHWQAEVRRRILDHAAAAVTTSDSAAEIFRGVYGDALPPLHVIEHGRDLKQRNFAKAPSPDEATRVLVLGNLTLPKGGDFLRKVIAFDREGRFEFHILGDAWPEYRNLGVWHGPYERDRLDEKVASIRPSLVGLFSIWGETYCHTLSEAWALGIPVVATNLGALAERIRRHGGGWLVDAYDPAAAYDVLCRIVDNPDEYQRQKARATIGNLRTVEAMADDYDALYRETLGSHRCINFTESLPVAPALAAG